MNHHPNLVERYLVIIAFLALVTLLWWNFFNVWHGLVKFLLYLAILVFALRIISDFNAAGLFKREHDTLFGYWDTHLYTLLCILIIVLYS